MKWILFRAGDIKDRNLDLVNYKVEEPRTVIKKISETPCMRDSYLYGICTGIGTGLAYFMCSSKPRLSTHAGFTGFVLTTLSYWAYCRYNLSKELEQARLFKAFLQGEVGALEDIPGFPDEGPVSVSNPPTSV